MAMLPDSRGATPSISKGKICNMVAEWSAKTDHPFISFEYFPPKTPEGVEKLHKVIATMAKQDPLFMDFTWGAGGTTSELTLDLSKDSQTRHNVMVNMRTRLARSQHTRSQLFFFSRPSTRAGANGGLT